MKKLLGRLASALGGHRPAAGGPAPDSGPAPSSFSPQNDLERLLMAAATDPSRRTAFQQALLRTDLYAATPEAQGDGEWRTLEADEQISLLHVTGPDGSPVPSIFTSEARIGQVFGPATGYIRMNGETLLGIVAGSGAFLNPGLDYGVHWTAADLAVVLGRPVQRTVEKETQVLLGSPSQRPEALIAELQRVLGSDPRIEQAWLALAQWPDADGGSWYLDVRTGLGADDLNALLADLFTTADFDGRPLDLVVNPPGRDDGVGIRVAPAQTH